MVYTPGKFNSYHLLMLTKCILKWLDDRGVPSQVPNNFRIYSDLVRVGSEPVSRKDRKDKPEWSSFLSPIPPLTMRALTI